MSGKIFLNECCENQFLVVNTELELWPLVHSVTDYVKGSLLTLYLFVVYTFSWY